MKVAWAASLFVLHQRRYYHLALSIAAFVRVVKHGPTRCDGQLGERSRPTARTSPFLRLGSAYRAQLIPITQKRIPGHISRKVPTFATATYHTDHLTLSKDTAAIAENMAFQLYTPNRKSSAKHGVGQFGPNCFRIQKFVL